MDLNFYRTAKKTDEQFLAGIDEVGRGPLAGPVVACIFKINIQKLNEFEFKEFCNLLKELGVCDSKKITEHKRNEIAAALKVKLKKNQKMKLKLWGIYECEYFISEIQHDEIDKINILNATMLAMKSSYESLIPKIEKGRVYIDGNRVFQTNRNDYFEPIIKGDSKSLLIGMASIIAKLYRDRLMTEWSEKYPYYLWDKNAGYGTAAHLKAISEHGISEIHRRSFKGVKEYC